MRKPLRVLMVEDCEDDMILVLRELRRAGYEPTHECVTTADAMAAALDEQLWDVIITDYVLPQFSGLDALQMAQEKDPETPVIVVSGKIGEDTAVAAMKSGASDYVRKDNLGKLGPAVAREIRYSITRQVCKHSLEQLEAESRRLKEISDAFPVGIVITDASGAVESSNGVAEAIWGAAPCFGDDLKASWCHNGERVSPGECALARTLSTGKVCHDKPMILKRADRKRVKVLCSASPLRDTENQVNGAVVVIHDVTKLLPA